MEFDNVKYEKAKAMARFNMFQRMKNFLQVLELMILLVLISWSTKQIPSAVKFCVNFLFELLIYFKKPHVVFIMVIFIVLALLLLCNQNNVENGTHGDDLHEEYALNNNYVNSKSEVFEIQPQKKLKDDEKEIKGEMQIVVVKNDECDVLDIAIVEASKKIRRFERNQSEKLKKDICVGVRKELRRSETENGRGVVGGGNSRLKMVDHLSNEEFKLAVDDFITRHRVFFKQQRIAEFDVN